MASISVPQAVSLNSVGGAGVTVFLLADAVFGLSDACCVGMHEMSAVSELDECTASETTVGTGADGAKPVLGSGRCRRR